MFQSVLSSPPCYTETVMSSDHWIYCGCCMNWFQLCHQGLALRNPSMSNRKKSPCWHINGYKQSPWYQWLTEYKSGIKRQSYSQTVRPQSQPHSVASNLYVGGAGRTDIWLPKCYTLRNFIRQLLGLQWKQFHKSTFYSLFMVEWKIWIWKKGSSA